MKVREEGNPRVHPRSVRQTWHVTLCGVELMQPRVNWIYRGKVATRLRTPYIRVGINV